MIGQFLSNTNESATVSILQNFLELNKALAEKSTTALGVYATLLLAFEAKKITSSSFQNKSLSHIKKNQIV